MVQANTISHLVTEVISTPIPRALSWAMIAAVLMAVIATGLRFRCRRAGRTILSRADQTQTLARLTAESEAQALLIRKMSLDLEDLRKRVGRQFESAHASPPAWPSLTLPIDLNRRGQILRLARKGKPIAEIAQDLQISQGEVELVLKLNDLSQENPNIEDQTIEYRCR